MTCFNLQTYMRGTDVGEGDGVEKMMVEEGDTKEYGFVVEDDVQESDVRDDGVEEGDVRDDGVEEGDVEDDGQGVWCRRLWI